MATGDITYDAGSPVPVGNRMELTGSCEVDYTPTTFAFLPTTCAILDAQLTCADGAGAAACLINYNSSDVATNGSCKIYGNHTTLTYRFRILFI